LKVDLVHISILTPLPGTPLYERYKERLIDPELSHYDFHHVVIKHDKMSAVDLQAGYDWITREFFHPWRITRRLLCHARHPRGLLSMPWVTTLNLAYYGRVKRWKLAGYNPEKSID
jgi:hypothetical protein